LPLIPLLGPDVDFSDIKSPLSEFHCKKCFDKSDLLQIVDQIEQLTNCGKRNLPIVVKNIETFLDAVKRTNIPSEGSNNQVIATPAQKSPSIKIKISEGITNNPIEPEKPLWLLLISAANAGEKTVTLERWGFRLPDNKTLVFPSSFNGVTMPFELNPGKKCQIAVISVEAEDALKDEGYQKKVELVGFFADQLDEEYFLMLQHIVTNSDLMKPKTNYYRGPPRNAAFSGANL